MRIVIRPTCVMSVLYVSICCMKYLDGKPPLPFELLKEKQDEFEAELQADKERKRNSYSSFDSIHFTMSV